MKKIITLFLISISLVACDSSLKQKKNIKTAEEFYKTYADRKDVKKLMDFYSDLNPQWMDAVSQSPITEGKENIKEMHSRNWEDKNYKKHQDYPLAVTVKEILANDSVVAVSGKYNPYYYNGNLINEMKFTAWLYFDKEGKIKKQIEWMQYSIDDLQYIINFKQNAQIQ
ncbi:MAG: hypothetical protein LBP34_01005 [Flavobacteriaceae bacterium]|jgi:hypothetical protein|nr:hypothetical protein [Flavobacteriaceae bacterium]